MPSARTVTVTLALLALLMGGCLAPPVPDDPAASRECTLIGCESQITFNLPVDLEPGQRYELEACVDGDCNSATLTLSDRGFGTSGPFVIPAAGNAVNVLLLGDDYSGLHQVSLTVIGPGGQVARIADEAVEFERVQPNGPGCEPVCWQATVR